MRIDALTNGLMVSCQPVPGGPMDTPQLDEIVDPLVRFPDARHHHAVRASGLDHVPQHRKLGARWLHGRNKKIEPVIDQSLTEPREKFTEIRIDEIRAAHRHDEAGEAGAPGNQLTGRDVGDVAITRRCLRHPLAGLDRDRPVAGQGPRHRCNRDIEPARQFAKRRSRHDAPPKAFETFKTFAGGLQTFNCQSWACPLPSDAPWHERQLHNFAGRGDMIPVWSAKKMR